MINNRLQKFLFHLTSVLTTWFPRGGAWFFNALIPPFLGNRILVRRTRRRNVRILRSVPRFERILVIPDIHIGDAVMLQGAVHAFRDFFPEARIDYVIKKSIACLIEGNPAISNLYPYFTGTLFPKSEDIEAIKKLVAENQYDLCFNCSPFFEDDRLFPPGQKILNLMTVAPQLIRNDLDRTGINHFLFQSYLFPAKLLAEALGPRPLPSFPGVPVTLSDEAVGRAKEFLRNTGVRAERPLLFLNPDTASPYTLMPFQSQADLLGRMASLDATILLGTAFTQKGIEKRLLETLPEGKRRKIVLVPPELPIDAYAALVDSADVFISGDTGPLHIAAARKRSLSGVMRFRNKTFVISVFGATPARMSGYDSTDPLYPPANQDAPSRTYVSESPCRNITCVNKMAKTCRKIRCFEVLDVGRIALDIENHLREWAAPVPA
jgi:ADP-heptose:LPS heptosyltransferase